MFTKKNSKLVELVNKTNYIDESNRFDVCVKCGSLDFSCRHFM